MIEGKVAVLGRAALDLLYPPRCVLCSSGEAQLCAACLDSLPRAEGERCPVCWLPLRAGGVCAACVRQPLAVSGLRSAFQYDERVRRAVHAFKFWGHSALAPALGAALAECYSRHDVEVDALVPVPLTGLRQRLRGYNQARLLARELGEHAGVPVIEALRRRSFAAPQAGSANAEARRRNVAGAFEAERRSDVRDLRLLLVDDVATTGSTLSACADTLLASGAAEVGALTLARED